jgi:antitoxin component YwqK of YwqJK toxin-antitoxin module
MPKPTIRTRLCNLQPISALLLLSTIFTSLPRFVSAQERSLYFLNPDKPSSPDSARLVKKGVLEGNKYHVFEYAIGDSAPQAQAYYLDSAFLVKDSTYIEYYSFRAWQLKTRGNYDHGKKVGKWITLSGKGTILDSSLYNREGKLHFQEEIYESGLVQSLTRLDSMGQGKSTGTWEDGTKEHTGQFMNWKKTGNWQYYDQKGILRDVETMNADTVTVAYYYDINGKNPVAQKPPYEEDPKYPGGYMRWNDYVNRSLEDKQLPRDYVDGKVHGVVEISFTVDEQGNVLNVRVRRSLQPQLDAIMVRIVSDSLGWSPAHSHNRTEKGYLNQQFRF